jgi:hypothetical protein
LIVSRLFEELRENAGNTMFFRHESNPLNTIRSPRAFAQMLKPTATTARRLDNENDIANQQYLVGMKTRVYDAEYWLTRAAEIRAVAEGMRDPISKQIMLQVAEDYQGLAEGARGFKNADLTRPSRR